jgi:hypothetical protein
MGQYTDVKISHGAALLSHPSRSGCVGRRQGSSGTLTSQCPLFLLGPCGPKLVGE